MSVIIEQAGYCLPEFEVSNKMISEKLNLDEDKIYSNTGIQFRRHLRQGESLGDLAIKAAEDCIGANDPGNIGAILVCSTVPMQLMPNTSSHLQAHFKIPKCLCFDLLAACSSFVYGMQVACALIESGFEKKVLVVGADALSRFSTTANPQVAPLFGDGAGGVLLSKCEKPNQGFLAFTHGSIGEKGHLLSLTKGGADSPYIDSVPFQPQLIEMDGMRIFGEAVRAMVDTTKEVLGKTNLSKNEIRWIVPHQANKRIIKRVLKELDISEDRCLTSIELLGNTGAASIPITYSQAQRQKCFKSGDYVLFLTFGGGLSYGASIYHV